VTVDTALAGSVYVVWARPTESARAGGWLDAREREQLARLKQSADRSRYVAAHALLRVVVARSWGVDPASVEVTAKCTRCGGPHGRPIVNPPPGRNVLHVSIAHAGNRVVVATTDVGPVGVDVEEDSAASFAGYDDVALADEETHALLQLPADEQRSARTRMWVRKEAVLKATGEGLSVDPRLVIVSATAQLPRLLAWPTGSVKPSFVHLTDLALGSGYTACAAVLAPRDVPVRLRNGDELLPTG
jgi:4'-phosphopantetheinyl transferase